MYDIFQRFRTIIIFPLLLWLLAGCDRSSSDSVKSGETELRLSAGTFEDVDLSFSHHHSKALILRNYPPPGKDVRQRGGIWERRIFELDFSNPHKPHEREIKELAEATEVSYMGGEGAIFAKDRSNLPVVIKDGRISPANLKGIKAVPSRISVSPDGRYLAFMATETPEPQSGQMPNINDFYYKAGIADLESGEVGTLSHDLGPRSFLEDLWWKRSGNLSLFYRFEDPDSQIFRVDEYNVATTQARLAFIGNTDAYFRLSEDNSFYVTHMLENRKVSFVSRDHRNRVDIETGGEIQNVFMTPDNRYVLVARYCEDTHGVNLFLLETPLPFIQKRQ